MRTPKVKVRCRMSTATKTVPTAAKVMSVEDLRQKADELKAERDAFIQQLREKVTFHQKEVVEAQKMLSELTGEQAAPHVNGQARKPGAKMTIKEGVLEILRRNPNGFTAAEITQG